MLLKLHEALQDYDGPGDYTKYESDQRRVRWCGLHKKPYLRDFALFVEWSSTKAPTIANDGEDIIAGLGLADKSDGPMDVESILAELHGPDTAQDLEGETIVQSAGLGITPVVRALLEANFNPDGMVSHHHKGIGGFALIAWSGVIC